MVKQGELMPRNWQASLDNPRAQLDLVEFVDDPYSSGKTEAAVMELLCFTLSVHNNSKEVIGEVEVSLIDQQTRTEVTGMRWGFGTLDPESSREQLMCTKDTSHIGRFHLLTAEVSFRDSDGVRWSRVDSEPVVKIGRS